VVQVALIAYYLGAAHSPQPRHLPVAYIASSSQAASVQQQIEKNGNFRAQRLRDTTALLDAIKRKDAYGGLDLTGTEARLYIASAAGPSAANALRTAFTTVVDQQRSAAADQLAASGRPVPAETIRKLAKPASVTDVVPLPAADRGGAALGLLVQVLLVGATIASTALGKLGPHTKRSAKRGVGHAAALIAYAIVSAAAVCLGATIFAVLPTSEFAGVFASFALLSLALSCSVAAAVALFGTGGAMLGSLYFLLGIVVSGASILPEFLPSWARVLGQALPPGSGATLIRERLYFPEASTTIPSSVLSAYVLVGLAVVLITNTLPTASDSSGERRGPEKGLSN
jgi:hypothetical protein